MFALINKTFIFGSWNFYCFDYFPATNIYKPAHKMFCILICHIRMEQNQKTRLCISASSIQFPTLPYSLRNTLCTHVVCYLDNTRLKSFLIQFRTFKGLSNGMRMSRPRNVVNWCTNKGCSFKTEIQFCPKNCSVEERGNRRDVRGEVLDKIYPQ